ncbi:hypothetical protein Aargi30884_17370 [Amedibacterium intestinale]|uniref:Radical SAM core domain-containing protein n=1 Tax=Amedibacterium intestinale TaxID=2583452 RepID=A0A6N4TK31_9FIRM|nr:radical SAM protein [Amedibacterium intestinale]BBK22834.1 hypothetical protein Aargi30884_17370 [Amedibacterium intestinale]
MNDSIYGLNLNDINHKQQSKKKKIILDYLSTIEKDEALFDLAYKKRIEQTKNYVYIRCIIDISNKCKCRCTFCGNSALSSNLKRYSLNKQEILSSIKYAKSLGIDMIHLASGEYDDIDYEMIIDIVSQIKTNEMYCELAIGIIPDNYLKKLKNVGLDRIIIKFETSNKKIFENYKKCDRNLETIIDYISKIKKMGFLVGTGNIVGFNGQTVEDLANDLLLVDKLHVDMSSTSCLTPNSDLNLTSEKGDEYLTLKYLSLMRIVLEKSNLCIPTNSTLGRDGKIAALRFGANEISLNITPYTQQNKYSIYGGTKRFKANYQQTIEIINKSKMKLKTYKEMRDMGMVP